METVTVATSRGFVLSNMELLIVSAIVLTVVAFAVVTSLKYLRNSRNLPHA